MPVFIPSKPNTSTNGVQLVVSVLYCEHVSGPVPTFSHLMIIVHIREEHIAGSRYCLISASKQEVSGGMQSPSPFSGSSWALLWTTSMLLFMPSNVGCSGKPQSKWRSEIMSKMKSPASWFPKTISGSESFLKVNEYGMKKETRYVDTTEIPGLSLHSTSLLPFLVNPKSLLNSKFFHFLTLYGRTCLTNTTWSYFQSLILR